MPGGDQLIVLPLILLTQFMDVGGFTRDYNLLADLAGHDYHAIHRDRIFPRSEWRQPDGWAVEQSPGFHGPNIRVSRAPYRTNISGCERTILDNCSRSSKSADGNSEVADEPGRSTLHLLEPWSRTWQKISVTSTSRVYKRLMANCVPGKFTKDAKTEVESIWNYMH